MPEDAGGCRKLNRDELLEEFGSDDVRAAAKRLPDAAEASGGAPVLGDHERLDSGNLR